MTRFHDGIAIQDDARRGDLQQDPTLNGIDYLEVDTSPQGDNERVLRVHFLPDQSPAPQTKLDLLWTDILSAGVMIDISGGTRIRNVQVIERHRVGDVLVLRVDLPGDYSDYTLTIDTDRLDPYYRQVVFNFKAGCPSRFDCKASEYCPPESRPAPAIDYMAKDYGSFRQALIDLIPTLAPDWTERRAADFGISLVELLAYAGDQLSYQQDAVANESYLETARQRISVRRHARLIDYGMHDGLSATTFLQLTITGLAPVTVTGRAVIRAVALPRALQQPASRLPLELQDAALREADAVFEVILGHDQKLFLSSQLNTIPLYTWGNRQVFLPRGATSADLLGNLDLAAAPGESWRLKPGDYLLFEEVKDPQSGQPQDANPEHRQVVRLTSVRGDTDPLFNQAITHVEWANADALSFPLCVAAVNEQTQAVIDSISVARGNLAVAFHGQSIHQGYPAELPPPGVAPVVPGIDPDASTRGYRFPLEKGPLSILPGPAPDSTGTPTAPQAVHDLQRSSPRLGYPAVMDVTEHVYQGASSDIEDWSVAPTLLDSSAFDRHLVVETDNLSRPILRFGDGEYGRKPGPNAFFHVIYRVGVGTVGNVGSDAVGNLLPTMLAYGPQSLDPLPLDPQITGVRNPLPAWGGTDPEGLDPVKQVAPAAFRSETFFAVTEADYAAAALKHPAVQDAVATFRWTGSWHTVFLTIDPVSSTVLDSATRQSVLDHICGYRLAGYDIELCDPVYVPVLLELDVCAAQGYFRADVEQAILLELSSRILPDGHTGFFARSNFTFHQPLFLSRIYERLYRLPGMESVKVLRFARRYEADPDPDRPATRQNLENGYIAVGRLEIIRLDNDPSFPENGSLTVTVRGGR